ncbi:MAG: HEAT repeat domain-containing protein, partial [Candidatus Marsarchaeota archaeon]|nr:HEAT repeat domain-containing protein [Candidatus Marsarchaeota archaeon]
PKGAQEGFEIRVVWPSAVASDSGIVQQVGADTIRYSKIEAQRPVTIRLDRQGIRLTPLVVPGDHVQAGQIIASVVPVTTEWSCPGGASVGPYIDLSNSMSHSDRFAAAKALGRFPETQAITALLQQVNNSREHVYVRLDAAAGLMRRGHPAGRDFLAATLHDVYLQNRLETAIVLGEVATPEAGQLLMATLQDPEQHPEIRAGAAWSLGEVGAKEALPALIKSFAALETVIRIEAARGLAKLARRHLGDVLQAFSGSTFEQRPGIAWALSKAGGFTISQIVPALVDDDARHWAAYMIGTQNREALLLDIETLAAQDPQVYFAVTVLWKIIASWVYGLEEY